MKLSAIRKGTKPLIKQSLGNELLVAYYVRRQLSAGGWKAVNILRAPDFEGLMSPDDLGITEMSDYDLSRHGEYAHH